ncbi:MULTISPECIES: YhjD/YihY/BrkB family envelope integrity protein [unclassified Corynebacterium]|uniref:YhjD/YihY/BrkB family envelope integrity protein n=1 Tax=unclassified Corynebacterium TaxID=2624378 RepID=UPI0029CA99E9|nr:MULTISPECIES: YhjD/YihY/BrkB family envelope integrity protein [unclassified Corynebacterium]WPF66597.1 YhjD/YihY/BrkB family envelope integrity protein [Corynebacterium sp. 22KM0430]WPF69085.1 YhjD/YihY/BrkB family envelope integrity protein [Corynebacterium sp. 21KM1197]
MATVTSADKRDTDEYGIERIRTDEPGLIDKLREKWGWFDHVMLMQERYSLMGGNQYSAGITYFSVLAMFPILMLSVAIAATVLAANPDQLERLQDQIAGNLDGQMGDMVNEILDTAIAQRGTVAGIGAVTALWSGLGWMNNLRYGVSKMWRVDPTDGNFAVKKAFDLVGLLGLLLSFAVAFGMTAVGSSGVTTRLLEMAGIDDAPGMQYVIQAVALLVGLLANFLVMAWMIIFLPRTHVPRRSGLKAAVIGAVAFEIIKQLGSVFASNALNNPAGATFGPIIGLMVIMYLIWRVVLYVSAWAATTEESLAETPVPAPEPAVIRVRNEIREETFSPKVLGAGAALGATAAWLLRRRK